MARVGPNHLVPQTEIVEEVIRVAGTEQWADLFDGQLIVWHNKRI